MKLEPGVLCVIVGAGLNEGRIVELIEYVPPGMEWVTPDGRPFAEGPEPAWGTEVQGSPLIVMTEDSTEVAWTSFCCIRQRRLKPLRDGEGVDEILRIAGHPLSQSHRERQPA